MKNWLKRNFLDVIYLWVSIVCALIYMVSGDVGYLIASLIAPITQYFHSKDKA